MFYSRCYKAEKGKCDVEIPELEPLSKESSHRVACFFPEEGDAKETKAAGPETRSENPP